MSTGRVCGEGARNQATKLLADDDDKYDVSASAVLVPGDVLEGLLKWLLLLLILKLLLSILLFQSLLQDLKPQKHEQQQLQHQMNLLKHPKDIL